MIYSNLPQIYGWLVWDPQPYLFRLPFSNHPITWYGLIFAFSFFVGYFLIRYLFMRHILAVTQHSKSEAHSTSTLLTDRLALLVIIGTVIGARLGHVFFYGWSYYSQHLMDIFKIWEGGLASHGGVVGVVAAILIFVAWNHKKFPFMTFLTTLDALCIAGAFAGGCIRIGNFLNQEVLGIPTERPWGVIFKHPIEGIRDVPLHPVQLYESFFYFAVFALLFFLWKRANRPQQGFRSLLGRGLIAGWFFLLIFVFRFFVEFLKLPQTSWKTGQWLSLPFIAFGLFLIIREKLRD